MILLGSTGSIGQNTLILAQRFNMKVEALSANNNVDLLNQQIKIFKPKYVAIANKALASKIAHDKIFVGKKGIIQMLENCQSDKVINAIVGFAGLKASLKSIELGKDLALANKESLVVAGKFLDINSITPIDSEHFGLWYLLNGKKINAMTITASGGAFRDVKPKNLSKFSAKDALMHPNWKMGNKITIDSATMANKLFELLEAKWLFNPPKISACIERSSLIHAIVHFKDGSSTAHIAKADMKLPIAYALNQNIDEEILPNENLLKMPSIRFEKINPKRYPLWELRHEILAKPDLGLVLNAANEIAVEKFLNHQINIVELAKIVKKAMHKFSDINLQSVEDIFIIDKEVRKFTKHIKP